MNFSARTTLWFTCITLLLLACAAYAQITIEHHSGGVLRVLLGGAIGITGLCSVFLFPSWSRPHGSRVLLALILPAALARVLLLPAAPSDDIHRYLWEGRLLSQGFSPYQYPADHSSYSDHRDEHWLKMNHKDQPTAYPPLALRTFQFIQSCSYHPMVFKVFFLLLDLALLCVILQLLRHFHLPARWLGFYALSPLSLLSYAAEAHFDILMVLPFAAAILAYARKKWWLCGILLGLAVGMKCMILVTVPFFFFNCSHSAKLRDLWKLNTIRWQVIISFTITLLLPLVGFYDQLLSIGEAILLFGSSRSFNGPSYQLLEWLFHGYPRVVANSIIATIYLFIWTWGARAALKGDLISSILWSLGGLVLLSPTVHFWYLAWILPFVCLRPNPFWLALSITAPLYFLVWHSLEFFGEWALPLWARWLFWLPSSLALPAHAYLRLFRSPLQPETQGPANSTIGIVIPTLHPGPELNKCLHSLPLTELHEVIIVDASPRPPKIPKEHQQYVTVHSSPSLKGRGQQIKYGTKLASSDWVIILHADATLHPSAICSIQTVVTANPQLLGGCFGQRYDRSSISLTLLEALNELRASCFQTSYGDQAQFFHRSTALHHDVLTQQPLMEDIEISQRLSKLGQTVYLGRETISSSAKWPLTGILPRFLSILGLLFRYHILTLGRENAKKRLSTKLYQEYYPTTSAPD